MGHGGNPRGEGIGGCCGESRGEGKDGGGEPLSATRAAILTPISLDRMAGATRRDFRLVDPGIGGSSDDCLPPCELLHPARGRPWRSLCLRARRRRPTSPNGKVIAEVIPVGNRVRTPEQIRHMMHSRPGVAYEEATVQEDVRRLHGTKWFTPGGVQILTKQRGRRPRHRPRLRHRTDQHRPGRAVSSARSTTVTELKTLSGVRKGEPMNPLANELGRQASSASTRRTAGTTPASNWSRGASRPTRGWSTRSSRGRW